MERLAKILNNLGLDGAMAEVFTYLAGRKRATMEEIYEDTSLSMKAVSMALEALEAEGAVKKDGPAFAVEDVRGSLMALLPARYEELKAEICSYEPVAAKAECPAVGSGPEKPEALPSRAAKTIDAALEEVDIISGSLAWLDDESLGAARAAVQRGVIVRVITHEHPGLRADVRALADAGVEVRRNEYSRSASFMIVDGELIAFDIVEPPGIIRPAHFVITIRDRGLCGKLLARIFEPAWKGAGAVEEYGIKMG